jgi:hypothetical protein
MGAFCVGGSSSPSPCATGWYCVAGSSSATQHACPDGFFCPGGAYVLDPVAPANTLTPLDPRVYISCAAAVAALVLVCVTIVWIHFKLLAVDAAVERLKTAARSGGAHSSSFRNTVMLAHAEMEIILREPGDSVLRIERAV